MTQPMRIEFAHHVPSSRQFCRTGAERGTNHSAVPAVTLTFDGGKRRLHWCAEHATDADAYRDSADRPARPSVIELAAIGRPGTVRASARAGSKAHLAELTGAQLDMLQAADNPSGAVSMNGSTGMTRPTARALDAKGYGRAMTHATRRHLIIGFEINDAGRRAVRAARGWPVWAGVHAPILDDAGLCYQNVPRPNGRTEGCGEPVKSPIHDPAGYLAYRAQLRAELATWVLGS